MKGGQRHENGAPKEWEGCTGAAVIWSDFSMRTEPPLGAQLVTPRRGYTHHGLYVGDGKVVHYAGLSGALLAGPIEEVPVARFACGHKVWIGPGPSPKYSGAEVVRRARSRLGENHYRLLTNNCEHFCMWCLCGVARSAQVDRYLAFPRQFLRAIVYQLKAGGAMSLRRSICGTAAIVSDISVPASI